MPDHRTSSDEPLSFSQQQEFDRLCSEFEQRWRAGERPRIEDYFSKVSLLRAQLLTELIAAEVDLRFGAGEDVQIDEYHRRFPDDRAAVDAGWAMIANRPPQDPAPASTVNLSRDNDLDTGGERADAHRDQPLPIADMIGRYKIVRELGKGVAHATAERSTRSSLFSALPRSLRFRPCSRWQCVLRWGRRLR
jgi:hypothetical protein